MIKRIIIGLIRIYQLTLSPWLGPRCRFYPSCSSYTIEAVQRKGVIRGCAHGAWRILRCQPFNKGGHDPVR